jgi:hypothetical protein
LVISNGHFDLSNKQKGNESRETLTENYLTTQVTKNWHSLKEGASSPIQRWGAFLCGRRNLSLRSSRIDLLLMRVKAILYVQQNKIPRQEINPHTSFFLASYLFRHLIGEFGSHSAEDHGDGGNDE